MAGRRMWCAWTAAVWAMSIWTRPPRVRPLAESVFVNWSIEQRRSPRACHAPFPSGRCFSMRLAANGEEKEVQPRREFGLQVAQDVAVWMLLAFATANTPLGPYLIYAGALAVGFAVCYQIYLRTRSQ
ncbi:unnamed protein product [Durusdinium trenchii]|uniref:Uncharacterized protein n=3 Tax=Durusdinium trenchii TaxID=1381693 RepID=A0ABP0QG74_9DINO